MDATDICVQWKGQGAVGYCKSFYILLMQMAKYSDKITWGYWPNKECHYALRNMELSSADKTKDNIFHHTNRYIPVV
jgi:hypothetical protein